MNAQAGNAPQIQVVYDDAIVRKFTVATLCLGRGSFCRWTLDRSGTGFLETQPQPRMVYLWKAAAIAHECGDICLCG